MPAFTTMIWSWAEITTPCLAECCWKIRQESVIASIYYNDLELGWDYNTLSCGVLLEDQAEECNASCTAMICSCIGLQNPVL